MAAASGRGADKPRYIRDKYSTNQIGNVSEGSESISNAAAESRIVSPLDRIHKRAQELSGIR
jgi:hypothetical protein